VAASLWKCGNENFVPRLSPISPRFIFFFFRAPALKIGNNFVAIIDRRIAYERRMTMTEQRCRNDVVVASRRRFLREGGALVGGRHHRDAEAGQDRRQLWPYPDAVRLYPPRHAAERAAVT